MYFRDVAFGFAALLAWEPIGPAPFVTHLLPDQPPVEERYSGRVQALVGDPADANIIYIGTTGGGVWKTIDGGASWTPLTDDQPTLNISSLALSGETLYASTFEVNPGSAQGVLKSIDGGSTWNLVGKDFFFRHSILKIVVDPGNPETVYAAVGEQQTFGLPDGRGIWKSDDGGLSWWLTSAGTIDENATVTDLVIASDNPDHLYAAVGELTGSSEQNGVYQTRNGGLTWRIAGDFPIGDFLGRKTAIKLAISSSNLQVLFAVIAGAPDPLGGGSPFAIYKTLDGGRSWNPTPLPAQILGNAYTSTVAVDPSNESIVYVCNEKRDWSMMFSADGGETWVDFHHARNRITPHADHRGVGFDAALNLLDGDDGGVFRFDRNHGFWSDLNTNLQTSLFASIVQHPTDPDVAWGGGFDNGANRKHAGVLGWEGFRPGDLSIVRLDPENPEIVYSQLGGVSLQRSDDGGKHWEDKVEGIVHNDRTATPPFSIDPRRSERLVLGTTQLYETVDRADSWSAFGTPFLLPIDAIGLAATDEDALYVSSGGKLYASTDRGLTWIEGSLGQTSADRFKQISVSAKDENLAYAVRVGLGHGNVLLTTNGGVDWIDIGGNLPNASAHSIAVDPRGGDTLYVGLDGGVYISADGGKEWRRFGRGLPNASVRTLDINTRLNVLVAGTYGRGAWRIGIDARGN
ncbi:MAG TPA: hypothetical protein VN918_04890 [Myxococcaceae bacterium]|nr:hypothetical protein [Myxococcaceae bacterium]